MLLYAASWLGHHEAPQTFRLRNRNDITRFGMNFAVAGSGVLEVPEKVATLSKQVDNFEGLIKDRTFPPWRLRFSLALVAVSGNDYARPANMSSADDVSRNDLSIYIYRDTCCACVLRLTTCLYMVADVGLI